MKIYKPSCKLTARFYCLLNWLLMDKNRAPRTHVLGALASRKGFEPPTPALGGRCSIQLSYRDMANAPAARQAIRPCGTKKARSKFTTRQSICQGKPAQKLHSVVLLWPEHKKAARGSSACRPDPNTISAGISGCARLPAPWPYCRTPGRRR